jgi:hypothetical protein
LFIQASKPWDETMLGERELIIRFINLATAARAEPVLLTLKWADAQLGIVRRD